MSRGLLLGLVAALACMALPSLAAAESCPLFDGATFPQIQSPEDPEDYCWKVQLNEGQSLQQIDDRHVGVMSKTGAAAWEIQAAPARDATGVEVPTTIAVSGEDLVTLTVHHLAGNPAAGGAAFRYPITPGSSYEVRPATVTVLMPPAEPMPSTPSAEELPTPQCEVPALQGRSLKAVRRALQHAHCHLGPVHGERSRGARVVRQYRHAGKTLPAGTEVGVKLA